MIIAGYEKFDPWDPFVLPNIDLLAGIIFAFHIIYML